MVERSDHALLHCVADRGRISAETIAELEQSELEYILGVPGPHRCVREKDC
jgi:transposase